MRYVRFAPMALALYTHAARASTQVPGADTSHVISADSLRLGALQDTAVMRDPRGRELALLAEQSRLRQQNVSAQRRPALTIEGQAQYQSDVAAIPFTLPGGISPATPPHDTYDAHLAAGQPLYDPTIGPKRSSPRRRPAFAPSYIRSART